MARALGAKWKSQPWLLPFHPHQVLTFLERQYRSHTVNSSIVLFSPLQKTETAKMRHVDGIGVNIASFKAEPRAAYHNPHEKRHGKFEGGFASRLIASAVGRQFMVQLEVAPEFHLLRSEGIIIIISIGDRTRLLTYAENAQCFWIPAQRFEKRRKYSIDRFKVWQNAESAHPTQQVPLYFPRPASECSLLTRLLCPNLWLT